MQHKSSVSTNLVKKMSWLQKQLSSFCWYWKIGWKNPITWVDNKVEDLNGKADITAYYEEIWVNTTSKEVRKISGKYKVST